ncbi:aldehyde dehydrogenase family protein [Solihabitans fulvus]|uniref:Aldehyde dehydrogenase family protein n=1 Tax=Solihabitans fulvus TaxID=1892852 RepID=A0A5B2WQ88_9PSEU|nr:aldehyde dehydrogenase family protein [Solihabitans fulvus]
MADRTWRLLIDGEWREPSGGHYPIVNPATEQVVGHAPEAGVADVADAVAAARAAFPAWSRTAPEERARLLDRVADLVSAHQDEIVPLAQAETGSTMAIARATQVPVTVRRLRRYARGALEQRDVPLAPQLVPASALAPGALVGAVAARRPVGVVGCITPYNFPIGTMAGKLAPALAMGNTAVVKPAPQDPLACLLLAELFAEAGFPPGVVNVVTGSTAETGVALVDSPDVDMISFTGSTAVGTRIAAAGGRTMKRMLLELGGKGAALVLADADLDTAVTGICATWTFLSGQGCILPTRAVVHRSIYRTVVRHLADRAGSLKVGDPLASETVLGPVISAAQRDRAEQLVESARAEGGAVVAGGRRPACSPGFYVAPTLITNVNQSMTVAREEVFGPVICVIPFDTEEEGVAIVNDTRFGLHNYVYTADPARGYRIAARLRSGYVGVNTGHQHPEAPFGGFGMSGIGRDGGSFGLDAYSEVQSVVWA